MIPFARIGVYGNTLARTDIIKKVQAGDKYVVILTTSGNLYSRGRNVEGQLGTGNTVNVTDRWVLVNTEVQDVWCSGTFTTLIIKNDGTWWYTGRAYPFTGTNATSGGSFVNISTNFSALDSAYLNISLGDYTFVVQTTSNRVYRSGYNFYGQLGLGNTNNLSTLTEITQYTNILQAVTNPNGSNIYLLLSTGAVMGAGLNSSYQLNDSSSTANKSTFYQVVPAAAAITFVAAGNLTSYFGKADGLYCSGSNVSGVWGNGAINGNPQTYAKASALIPVEISTRSQLVHMRVADGTWYCTGANTYSLGTGSSASVIATWTAVPDLLGSTSVAHGDIRTYNVKSNVLYGVGRQDNTYAGLLPDFTDTVQTISRLAITGVI